MPEITSLSQISEHAQEIDYATGENVPQIHAQGYGRGDVAYYLDGQKPMRYEVFPGPTNVHQNQALSTFAINFEIDSGLYISPRVTPVMTVAKRSDIYYTVSPQGQDLVRTPTDNTDVRAIGAIANEVQPGFSTTTYTAIRRAVRDFLPDGVAANEDEALQLMTTKTQFLEQFLLYRWDVRTILTTLGTLGGNATFATACGTGGKHIADATTTTKYIQLAFNYVYNIIQQQNLMRTPTHLVLGSDVARAIAASPEVAGQVVYSIPQFIQQGGLSPNRGRLAGLPPTLYDIEPVVCPHIQNTAKLGQTPVFSNVTAAAGTIAFVYVEPPSRMTQNTATTFRVGGIRVKTYRDEPREGTWIECNMDQAETVTNSFGGYLLTNCISG